MSYRETAMSPVGKAIWTNIKALLLVGLLLLTPGLVQAHKVSDSFLYLTDHSVRLDLAIEDLLRLDGVGGAPLDHNGDGRVIWGELLAAEGRLATAITGGISLRLGQSPCNVAATLAGISRHSDGPYSAWQIESPCLTQGGDLSLSYDLLFKQDPLHRGLYRLQRDGGEAHFGVLSPQSNRVSWAEMGYWSTAKAFFVQGVIHLVTGYDHLLFLLALLLPVLREQSGERRLSTVVRETVWIVTMFTAAHSVTLALATLGYVSLPSAPVEVAIALSVTAAALLALSPLHYHYQMALAFGFGLIHGLGFAGMLAGLLDATAGKAVALLSFNVGIELAQLLLVAVLVPILYALRNYRTFFNIASPMTSTAIAVVGLYWAWLRV
ncbi:HupE/UreJ family protein [Spongiibacter nanhainus]|uniref:HupE/UreJ family protein n=1 Tax=Spongiibacter nanhainus TaxID=2794344 RepID=A0A7T4QYJ6_9GAMM|nr:HupE/UreJ family protein [Spongiibacter nanhainus]QQD17012.1 HupE/UreJ family protein [Spongiibacter nanhainus]